MCVRVRACVLGGSISVLVFIIWFLVPSLVIRINTKISMGWNVSILLIVLRFIIKWNG
jgi:hypothetical protein